MRLSWNKVRARAGAFADDWRDAAYEKGETQSFYNCIASISACLATLAMMWCSRAAGSVPALVGALCCFAAVSAAAQTRDDFEYWDTNGNGDLTCSEALSRDEGLRLPAYQDNRQGTATIYEWLQRRRSSDGDSDGIACESHPNPNGYVPGSGSPTVRGCPVGSRTWMGLAVCEEPTTRTGYDRDDYGTGYRSLEDDIIDGLPQSGGKVYTPYTCALFDIRADGTAATDIEHIVALAEAHDSGIADGDRRRIASDLLNLTIAAPTVNRQDKSDQDAGEWTPPSNRGWFAAQVVAVKRKYGLSVNADERDTLARMLQSDASRDVTCGGGGAPTSLILTGTPAPFEGGPDVTVTATLNNPAPANGTTVMLVPSGTATRGTNGDYTLSSTTIAIAARQMEGTATLTITDDTDDDDGETIVLDATSANPALTAQPLTLTIADNDGAALASSSSVPLFPSARSFTSEGRQGFVRVVNRSGESGEVRIDAFDDDGMQYGPLTLEVGAGETVHFNSGDLERGNADKGLTGATGAGEGSWRLALTSTLDIEVLSYLRTHDGFVTSMHDLVPRTEASYRVPIFNRGSNTRVSQLRVINPGAETAEVTIEGVDDAGESPGGAVRLSVPGGAARTLTSRALETGDAEGLSGALGTGAGKWRLVVTSDQSIQVMSLLSSPAGHLTNLSTVPDNAQPDEGGATFTHGVPLFLSARSFTGEGRQSFVRIINHAGEGGSVRIDAFDDDGMQYGPLTLEIGAGETVHFNSDDLEQGNTDKGLTGATGSGEGSWRLALTSTLDIEVLSYLRTHDGFVTSMHDLVPYTESVYRVAIFNRGSNTRVSQLRLVNPGTETAEVTIEGVDDAGESPGGAVRLSVPGGGARTVTSRALETGEGEGLSGALGDGAGKWRLIVSSDQSIRVMSLLSSPTGHLTNLSTVPDGVARDTDYWGQVTGHADAFEEVEVLLSAQGTLRTTTPDSNGWFVFRGLARGKYVVKVRAAGYKPPPARVVRNPARGGRKPFHLEALPTDSFLYHWEEDQSTAGTDYAAHVNEPPQVEFLDEPVELADGSSSSRLRREYNMLLVDSGGGSWSQEHAYRLLETMKSIPQYSREDGSHFVPLPSRWQLSAEYLHNDIEITRHADGSHDVVVSEAAFVNAAPRVATVDGKRGIWFSRRLHHALVRYVTDNGRDERAYEKILQERYGLTTRVDDYAVLTAETTRETAGRFQPFHAEEIVQLIDMLEEMPKGLHRIEGFHTLVRRLDGTPNPVYPQAPAIAWVDQGYAEFMDLAFLSGSVQHMHRLILHEKAHFLWAHVFDEQLKEDWIALGGWYRDPGSPSGWSTTRQTEFVSGYAHLKNPDEDMAESIAYFIVNPDKLKSRAFGKYEFVRDRTMQGNIYLSQIREDLTFEVYNLFPDYVFPGKIRRVDIRVGGAPEADKQITIEIALHALDNDAEGARWAQARISSDVGTFFDINLEPRDESGRRVAQGVVLTGSHTLSKHAKAGYWLPEQIVLWDTAGNKRFERTNDFGWELYVNNPLEDIMPPEYVAGSARLSVARATVEGHDVQVIHAAWGVKEDNVMLHSQGCFASLNDEVPSTYRFQKYGDFNAADGRCYVDFVMPDYMPSSVYSLDYIDMRDAARNYGRVYFTDDPTDSDNSWQEWVREYCARRQGQPRQVDEGGVAETCPDEAPRRVRLVTANPDIEAPELALNRIELAAEPTHPDAPNGETIVTMRFQIRDNISGYKEAALNLRDPQGIEHFQWTLADDRDELYPRGDPTVWKWHTATIILPPGSAPGTWGLADMTIYDRAENFRGYDFTEIIHFEVE